MASKHHHLSNLDDESEETLSLCDLSIYGYESQDSTTDSQDSMKGEENFEFFSQEWLKNNQDLNLFPNKGVIFCGSLILPENPISRNTQEFKKHDLDTGSLRNMGRNYGGIKHEKKRVSIKSRWYYYGFGLAGIPTEMELSAIRSRQHRHQKNHRVGALGGTREESGGFRQGKWLGRLIRDLICDGQTQADSMVKASLVYIPRV